MALRIKLSRLLAAVIDEAARNPEFAARLEEALDGASLGKRSERPDRKAAGRRGGRRAAAVLDPVALAQNGEDELRSALGPLDHDQLLDVVAEHGMDPGKLVMKWKDRDRIVDRIVEIAVARSTKGDAFRLS
jgi:hypothetical protein